MTHSTRRALPFLLFVGCNIVAGCSFQVPKEDDVFGNSGVGGQFAGGSTSTSGGGATPAGGISTHDGGTTSTNTAGATTTVGAGGTSSSTAGGTNTAGAVSVDAAGTANTATNGGSVAAGGSVGASGSLSTGGVAAAGSSAAGGSVAQGSTAGSHAGAGSGAIGGIGQTGGAPIAGGGAGNTTAGRAATGGVATGGVATGGAATGGAATGGVAPTGGAPPQVILQYKFDETEGGSAADATPNHRDGTVSNTTWSGTGRNGGCISYAAADSQVAVPSNLLGTSHSLTISAWVKLASNAAENRLFYFGTSDGASYLTLTFNNSANGISVRFKATTGTEQVLTTPTQLPLSIWKHVTVSVSNVGAALYIDGKIVAQDRTLVMDPTTLGTPMTNLVGSSPTAGQAFQGLIDEFYVYEGILPVSDIRQLAWPKLDYTAYHLDEGTGTSTADSSDRGANGTLTGGATWVASPFGTGVMLANNPSVAAQQYVALLDGAMMGCTTAATFSAWINLTTNTTDAPVLEFAQSATLLTNISTYSTAKAQAVAAHYFLDDSKTFTIRQLGATYALGQWTHIAAVRGDNTNGTGRFAAVYLNGTQVAVTANTSTGAFYVTPTPLSFLGRSQNSAMAGFNGAIDEVLVACRQYSDDEIKHLAYRPPN